jgi:hypothetical protein
MPATCKIPECEHPVRSRGWCERHYKRWYSTGDPLTRSSRGHSLEDRLRRRLTETPGGCWVFSGANKGGSHRYGQLKVAGRMVMTHRIAYELWVGPIPSGFLICHSCDNPPCCNPEHLFLGRQDDNMADMAAKGRHSAVWQGVARPDLAAHLRDRAASKRREAARAAGCPEDWKHCAHCATWKSPSDFALARNRPDGLQVYCRACLSEIRTARRQYIVKRS